jgi:adenylate cyclase
MSQTRRLAAILAADVAGYSRLIGADEEGTLQAFRTIRTQLFDPTVAAHNGRLVKTTGDGFLGEFGSVVDALRYAVEVSAKWPYAMSVSCRRGASSSASALTWATL